MDKLRTNRGETLVETLISIIIVVISVAFLVTSITAAARINSKVKNAVNSQMSFTYEDSKELGRGNMTVEGVLNAADPININVKIYESNGYYYYIKESDKNGQNN